MSDYEIITDGSRRRRWSSSEKLRIVEGEVGRGPSGAAEAAEHGRDRQHFHRCTPQWCRTKSAISLAAIDVGGGAVAVSGDDDVTSNRAVRQMEDRIRELERHLGCKTLEILKEALDKTRSKKTDVACSVAATVKVSMSVVEEALGVFRSNLHARLTGSAKPRRRYHKAQDGERRRPQAKRRRERGAIDHGACGGTPNLRILSHYSHSEPAITRHQRIACNPQAGLSDHAGAEPAAGAALL